MENKQNRKKSVVYTEFKYTQNPKRIQVYSVGAQRSQKQSNPNSAEHTAKAKKSTVSFCSCVPVTTSGAQPLFVSFYLLTLKMDIIFFPRL